MRLGKYMLIVRPVYRLKERKEKKMAQFRLYMDWLLIKYAECPDRAVYMHFSYS